MTYSTKPRGGVVHTLALAEALVDLGVPAHVVTLGQPGTGFYRTTSAPFTIVPAPSPAPTLEERVFASVDALEAGLRSLSGRFELVHAQDCISARAAARVRDAGDGPRVVRTVHHIDDFTTQALIDCQRQSVVEPDAVLVVSNAWRDLIQREFRIEAQVVRNGVDVARFPPISPRLRTALRMSVGAVERPLLLGVGGIEPRKGSVYLVEALARLRQRVRPAPVLAVIGGHSFQDYEQYRQDTLRRADELGLRLGHDIVLLGTVPDVEMPGWYRAADVLAFPSVKEGFGLAVLEAMAADLPVVTSDIAVFREYLTPGDNALLASAGDVGALADALHDVVTDTSLRARLIEGGRRTARAFTWHATAEKHREIYDRLVAAPVIAPRVRQTPCA